LPAFKPCPEPGPIFIWDESPEVFRGRLRAEPKATGTVRYRSRGPLP
jgi:hypothetical protein